MCKGITSQGRKCQSGNPRRDYCHHHNPELFTNNLAPSLNSVKYYFHWDNIDNTRQITFRRDFLINNTSEGTRRHLFDEVMPFLRDCWKWGHPGTDRFSIHLLCTHFPRVGVREDLTDEQLGGRRWTEAERRAENARLAVPLAPPAPPILQRQDTDADADAIGENIRILARPPQLWPWQPQLPRTPRPQNIPAIPKPFEDSQSVHRTSVNESVNKSVEILCAIDWNKAVWPMLAKDGEKLPPCKLLLEKIFLWNQAYSLEEKETIIWPKLFPLIDGNKIGVLMSYNENIYGKKPWFVLYKTFNWIFQQTADVQKDALLRVLDELYDGRDMCIAGKVSRIVNSLVGIHPDIHIGLSGKEMLQERMAALATRQNMDPEVKMEEGRVILREANVPESDWEAWLEPLLLDY